MGDGPPLDDAYETPEWAKTNPDGSWKNPGNTSTSVSEGVTDEGVIATETKEEEVEILTDLKEYFELPDVGKELIGTAIFQFLFDLLVTIYNYRGYDGDIDRVDFTSVVSETYTKAFMLGWIVTAIGHMKAKAVNKEKVKVIPYLHPDVWNEGGLKYVPRGADAKSSLVTALFWTVIMGSGVVGLVLVLWLAMGMDQEEDKMNGYLYSVYQAAIGGFFGWNVIAVGMIQGSTAIPPKVLIAYEKAKQGGDDEENGSAKLKLDAEASKILMVNSALKFWKSFTHLHRAILFSLVFAVACACTGFTYGYLYDGDQNEGDGGLNRVEGRDQLIADMTSSTLFASVAVSATTRAGKG